MSTRRLFLTQTAAAGMMARAAGTVQAAAKTPVSKCPSITTPLKDVEGKVAFITGGSSGIGLGMAQAFADAGMKVVIGYRTKAHLDEAMRFLEKAGDRVHAINVDVTDRPGMKQAAAETVRVFGKVHILVNNAGVAASPPLNAATYDDWDFLMGVNLHGPFNGVLSFLPYIQAQGEGGQIVTTSSILGLIVSNGGVMYSASKAGVIGMMEAMRGELAPANIGVSVYIPGVVNGSDIINSNRNRPSSLSNTREPLSPDEKSQRAFKQALSVAMDPLEAGRLVLRGIRNNDLYIFSHPEFEQGIRDRNEALIASIPTDVPVPEARLKLEEGILRNPMYVDERDRMLCGRRTHV